VLRTARYRVDRATPKRAAISATGMSAVLSSARIVLISLTALETGFKLRPGGVLAGGVFFVSLAAPGAFQRVLLQIDGLIFGRST
jgi:hypothetical protein